MSNEEIIWNFLYEKLNNPYGAAAMMGNLFAESSLNPILANNVKKKTGLTNEQYTSAADSRMNNSFVSDRIAYGLAQWAFSTRKKGLLDYAEKKGTSVGDIHTQLEYLWEELQKYKTVINVLYSSQSVKEASDIVLLKYEKPANQSDAVKQLRAKYGQKYFDKYATAKETIKIVLPKKLAKEIKSKLEKLI